jgi:hypothetical protein
MKIDHSIQNSLAQIGYLNRHLADELAKLPELREDTTTSSRLALYNLSVIYRFAPERFNRMFARMDTIGLPAHRDYCTPLQAFFWMIQDERLEASGMLLGLKIIGGMDTHGNCRPRLSAAPDQEYRENRSTVSDPAYTLKKILDAAWNGETRLMLGSMIRKIINRLPAPAEAREYALLVSRHSNRQLQGYIMDDFLRKKEAFSAGDWNTIATAVRRSRWKRFYTVADRLNSPELVSYYINKYFFFRKSPASGVYSTFFNKTAQCTDAAYFAQFMLKRAGYRTFLRSVKWDEDPWDGLHTGSGIILDDGCYLLVSNYTGVNAISGPFDTLERLDRRLSCNRRITGRKWGAYFPPRFF